MLTNNDNIEKIDYRQGAFSRTPSANEMIERLAYRQLRTRVKSTLQTGTINHIVGQEISAMISEALSAQLAAERDAALGSQPYERGGATKRNGYKLKSLPGLWGAPDAAASCGARRKPVPAAAGGAGHNARGPTAHAWLPAGR